MSDTSHVDLERVELIEERRITAGIASHRHPAWSPDGRSLAYQVELPGGSEIVVADRRGRFGAVVARSTGWCRTPAWSPEGKRLAYSHQAAPDAPRELWQVEVLAGAASARRLTPVDGGDHRQPCYQPDGPGLLYVGGPPQRSSLFLLDGVGTSIQLSFDQARADSDPSFSPDGATIAFAGRPVDAPHESHLHLMAVASGQVERVSPDGVCDHSPFFIDRRLLGFVRETSAGRVIGLLDRGSGRVKLVTRARDSHAEPAATVTPKGTVRLAFTSDEHAEPPLTEIVTAELAGLRRAR